MGSESEARLLRLSSDTEDILSSEIRLVTKSSEDGVLFVEQVEDSVKFSDGPLVHNEDPVVVS